STVIVQKSAKVAIDTRPGYGGGYAPQARGSEWLGVHGRLRRPWRRVSEPALRQHSAAVGFSKTRDTTGLLSVRSAVRNSPNRIDKTRQRAPVRLSARDQETAFFVEESPRIL